VVVGDVADSHDLFLGPYQWPTFNLADVAVNVGNGLLLVDAWQRRRAAAGRRWADVCHSAGELVAGTLGQGMVCYGLL
jgi:hypothetical protein